MKNKIVKNIFLYAICLVVFSGVFAPVNNTTPLAGAAHVCLAPAMRCASLVLRNWKSFVLDVDKKQFWTKAGSGGTSEVVVKDFKLTFADGSFRVMRFAEKVYRELRLDPSIWEKVFKQEVDAMLLLASDPLTRNCGPVIVDWQKKTSKDTNYFIRMEHLEGFKTLREQEYKYSDLGQLLDLLFVCSEKMRLIHSKGIVHHDICTANIMVKPIPDAPPEVRIIDYGIAGQKGTPSLAMGHIYYMPAEVLGKKGTSVKHLNMPEIDVFSMGMVFAERLIGKFGAERHMISSENIILNRRDRVGLGQVNMFTRAMRAKFPGFERNSPHLKDLYDLIVDMYHHNVPPQGVAAWFSNKSAKQKYRLNNFEEISARLKKIKEKWYEDTITYAARRSA